MRYGVPLLTVGSVLAVQTTVLAGGLVPHSLGLILFLWPVMVCVHFRGVGAGVVAGVAATVAMTYGLWWPERSVGPGAMLEVILGAATCALIVGIEVVRRRRAARLARPNQSRRQAEEALRTSQQHLHAILSTAPVVLAAVDREGVFTLSMGRALQRIGREPGAVVGRSIYEVYADAPQVIAGFHRALQGETVKGPVEYRGILFDTVYAPLRNDHGQIVGVLGVGHDVTTQQHAERLEDQRRTLETTVRGMESVLGVVGHELRTPLAGLRAMAELLLTGDVHDQAQHDLFLRAIHDEAIRMSGTVNDLLEVARLNSGSARWNWGRFHLAAACRAALESITPLVDAARITLRLEVPDKLELRGDADGIRRLILNLLSNACKHTTDGFIAVRARALPDPGGMVEIVVQDTGCGMSPQTAAHLGEAFALNSGMISDRFGKGAGLGLAICKRIADAHAGRITVRSTPGEGTTIRVLLRGDLPAAAKAAHRIEFVPTATETVAV